MSASNNGHEASEEVVNLASTRSDRLCLIGRSDRLPAGPVLVLFPWVPGRHGSSVVGRSPSHPEHTNFMDFNNTRYIPMSRRRRIYEGKAKVLYEGPEPGTLIQHFKDDATAF